ncbi:uncharacterized protein L203_102267 [Cryptococcus depauperatus CBS 7841]|uniref:Uncharacterized protein n=1 Tax=Cryptococcus depauperatus CBS 7841 TaxID=1295531 RepID=A0A1E3IRT0_9TREE|nr:hypothetical protein L203_01522 [Cryptococcus depauperatus CBS 7841]
MNSILNPDINPPNQSNATNPTDSNDQRGLGPASTTAPRQEWFSVPEHQRGAYRDYLEKTIQKYQGMAEYHRGEATVNQDRARRIVEYHCSKISNSPASATTAMHTAKTDLETVQTFLSTARPNLNEYKKANDACSRILAREIEYYDQYVAECIARSGDFQKVSGRLTEASELKTSTSSVFMSLLEAEKYEEAAELTQQHRTVFDETGRADLKEYSSYWTRK